MGVNGVGREQEDDEECGGANMDVMAMWPIFMQETQS